jgi:hypothetical protein
VKGDEDVDRDLHSRPECHGRGVLSSRRLRDL